MIDKILNFVIGFLICIILLIIIFGSISKDYNFNFKKTIDVSPPAETVLLKPQPLVKNLFDYFRVIKNDIETSEFAPDSLEKNDEKVYIELKENISGILIKSSGNIAIIDGVSYSKGDMYDEKSIIEILNDRIYLKQGFNYYVMYFK
jgi:hypothetical protein